MNIAMQNLPFLCLIWIGIGFLFIIIGVLMVASEHEKPNHYTEFAHEQLSKDYNKEVEELFSYFLEEEEKKNQDLRKLLLEALHQKDISTSINYGDKAKLSQGENLSIHKGHDITENLIVKQEINEPDKFQEIVELYNQGFESEAIAKKLKKGVGEVNLMITLYTMK